MNAELGLIFGILIFGMALLVGVAIGFQLSEDQRTAGNLVIAPGDEDAPNYMFLDLDMNPEMTAIAMAIVTVIVWLLCRAFRPSKD